MKSRERRHTHRNTGPMGEDGQVWKALWTVVSVGARTPPTVLRVGVQTRDGES